MTTAPITLTQATTAFLQAKQAAGKSPNTLRNYRGTFAKLNQYLSEVAQRPDPPLAALDGDALTGFLAWLQAETFEPDGAAPRGTFKLSAKSILNIHTDLSALWTWARDRGLVAQNIVRQIEAPDPNAPVIEAFTQKEIEALVEACQKKRTWKNRQNMTPEDRPTADRDRALILLLVDTGLRASELCQLKRADLNMAAGAAKVLGKGQKERVVYFGKRSAKALWPLLTAQHTGAEEYVFTVGPARDARPLDRSVLCRLLKRVGERAGVANVYPHRFRHTFAITYLRNGGDLFTLQALLGHSDLAMVKRYANIAQLDCARVHAKASPVDNWKL